MLLFVWIIGCDCAPYLVGFVIIVECLFCVVCAAFVNTGILDLSGAFGCLFDYCLLKLGLFAI